MKIFLFNLMFWVLKIPSQPSGQGKHLCIVKMLEIFKIKFRKNKKVSGLETRPNPCCVINHSFRPLGHKN